MTVPELEECPNCGNKNVYCHTHILDVDDTKKKCTECGTKFNLGEVIFV